MSKPDWITEEQLKIATNKAIKIFDVWEFNRELEKVEQPEPIEYSQRVADYNDAI